MACGCQHGDKGPGGLGEREILATLRSGLTAGLRHPRKVPK